MWRRKATAEAVEEHAVTWDEGSLEALTRDLASSRIVLLGEASHGSYEFYAERARITRRLIEEHDFDAVAAEADWPDAYRLGCYVRGVGTGHLNEPLRVFGRFPRWMWANEVVADFAT